MNKNISKIITGTLIGITMVMSIIFYSFSKEDTMALGTPNLKSAKLSPEFVSYGSVSVRNNFASLQLSYIHTFKY